MLLRLHIRKLSQFCNALLTNKGVMFLKYAPVKLNSLVERQGSSNEISYWSKIVELSKTFISRHHDYLQLKSFQQAPDPELRELAEADNELVEEQLEHLARQLVYAIAPRNQYDNLSKCQLEFTAGVGGTEAMLFTGELISMYEKLADQLGLEWTALRYDRAQLGGARSAVILLSGKNAYRTFRFEAGVHRVQRIPLTDKTRMHTSTTSLAVLPEPEQIEAYLSAKDVEMEAIRASGPGGQNVNKRATAVRLTHKETGISVHCMDERFQHLNIQIAYRRLAAILMQRQQDSAFEKISSTRKLQIGSRARAEKVRTYNFKDDRVTDHRLRKTVNNVEDFMNAGHTLINMVNDLDVMFCLEQLEAVLDENFVNDENESSISL